MRQRLNALFAENQTQMVGRSWRSRERPWILELGLEGSARPVSILDAREDITRGQVVSRHVIEGANGNTWTTLARGTTIGYRRLYRIPSVTVSRLRLTVEEGLAEPVDLALRAWHG
jgi:alpha-L-fucosidase